MQCVNCRSGGKVVHGNVAFPESIHVHVVPFTLRKHAYSNIYAVLKNSPLKTETVQLKNSDIFHISAQNINYEYSLEPPLRGGSNEYHNLCF